jgi:bacillolysin
MRHRTMLGMVASGMLAATSVTALTMSSTAAGPPAAAAGITAPAGSFALTGQQAASFQLPRGMQKLDSLTFNGGSTQTRFQQYVGRASVFGGQITVNRNAAGTATSVVGAYFPGLKAKNSVKRSAARAKSHVARSIGLRGDWSTTLRLDPRTGKLFYEVSSVRASSRPVRWINAQNGRTMKAFNALAHGEGEGVKGDTKQIDTVQAGGVFELRTADDRQETYNAGNKQVLPGTLMTDADDVWNFTKSNFRSPDQRPGVDAHYYAGVVDDFYGDVFARDSIDGEGMTIVSTVHFANRYCNAFWNGEQMTYGDGDGKTCLPLSGGLDVVGHELTHGVTEFTSGLIYEDESGALNESFSDMMGNTIEFYAADNGLDPAATPDWLIAEDVYLAPDDAPGFRNMSDPQEDADPDHYSELIITDADNGGVHSNSGIPNHAYYLAVNGGKNAGCDTVGSGGHTHTADCDVTVAALGLATARSAFYQGFTSLPEYANMCDARNATVAVNPGTSDAWAAVGVHAGCTPGVPPPPPCEGSDDATIPFGTPHPYGNNADCTWIYDNGSPGFAFHFSLLDTEKNFDYVYVKDADGNVLATYTGTFHHAITSPCIPTSTGSVQFTSDPAVTAQGFTVDAVEAC